MIMENVSPEKKFDNVKKAAINIQNKGRLDADFPDLYMTFKGKDATYDTVKKVEIVQPVISKHTIMLPSQGLESIKHYNAQTSPSGIEPSLNRAYYAIKNILYLWDYSKREMLVHEESDDIVGLAFVKPKPDIFANNITHLLIISTVKEVKIHAISYNAATFNVYQTEMSTATTGVNLISIVGTKFGRIFMLGNDGNIWELYYRNVETWFTGKCTKILHTSGVVSSFFNPKTRDPIKQIVVDETGTILYQLTEASHIIVTYLGANGQSFKTIDQYTSAKTQASKLAINAPQLGSGTVRLISIHPTLPTESKCYQLVAITSTGCRLYFTHASADKNLLPDNKKEPAKLDLIHVRVSAPDITKEDVFTHTYYKNAVFLGVKNQHILPTHDELLTYTPDLGSLANPIAIMNKLSTYREFTNVLNVPGKIISLVEQETPSTCKINELTASYEEPSRTFLALTTFGLSIFVKQRPIDMLCKLLAFTNQDTRVRLLDFQSFCQYFGNINVVSLCLAIMTCPSLISSDGLNCVEPIPTTIMNGAIDLLVEFGKLPSEIEPQYTNRHDGLALYIYRVLNPVWNKPLVKQSDGKYTSLISLYELQRTQQVMKQLSLLIQNQPNLFQLSHNIKEQESLKNLGQFVEYSSEAISFIQYIIKTDLTTVIKGLKPDLQKLCESITLRELLSTPEGRRLGNSLAYSLIEYTFTKLDNTSYVIDVLTQHCKSFCGGDDVSLYKATKQVFAARSASNTTQANAMLSDALKILKRIALHITADKAQEIAQDFAQQGYPIYGIQATLDCAHARSLPQDKLPFYDIVFDLLYQVVTKPFAGANSSNDRALKRNVLAAAFESCDMVFAFYLYEKFLQKNICQELIEFNPPYLENFLTTSQPLTAGKIALVAKYYKMNERYEEAAVAYYNLATHIDDVSKKIEYLTSAAICARSVTSPAKQYDIYLLNEAIKENLEQAHQQQAIPTQ